MEVESERAWRYEIDGRLSTLSITSILMVVAIMSIWPNHLGAAECKGDLAWSRSENPVRCRLIAAGTDWQRTLIAGHFCDTLRLLAKSKLAR